MKVIKNISAKIIGIPNSEGGNTALLPDNTIMVEDELADNDALRIYENMGLITVKDSKAKPAKAASENHQEQAVPVEETADDATEDGADAEPAAEVKAEKAGRRGRVSTKK